MADRWCMLHCETYLDYVDPDVCKNCSVTPLVLKNRQFSFGKIEFAWVSFFRQDPNIKSFYGFPQKINDWFMTYA